MRFYATLGSEQPGAPGCIAIDADTYDDAYEKAHRITNGRFCTVYRSLDEVHVLDRFVVGENDLTLFAMIYRRVTCVESMDRKSVIVMQPIVLEELVNLVKRPIIIDTDGGIRLHEDITG